MSSLIFQQAKYASTKKSSEKLWNRMSEYHLVGTSLQEKQHGEVMQ